MYWIVECEEQKLDDRTLLVSSNLYGSVIKLLDSKKIEEYYFLKQNGCKVLKTELQIGLHEQGILMGTEEMDEIISMANNDDCENMNLIIMPTDACNFRCIYCYEEHESSKMNEDVVESVKKFIEKSSKAYKRISIEWFGGEPLLCKDSILEINKRACEIMENSMKEFSSSMTTNGYLLDIETFKLFYQIGITSYQITIDGWNHDMMRPLLNGKGSLKKIIENLDEISRLPKEYQFEIIIRHNVLEGDQDYSWYDYLREKYGNDSRFSIYIHSVDDWGGEGVKKLGMMRKKQKEVTVMEHNAYIEQMNMKYEREDLTVRDRLGGEICYAGRKDDFVIRADGSLQKCTLALDEPENEIGYIDLDGNAHINQELHKKWYDIEPQDQCYSCKKIFTCMSKACPLKRIKGKKFICDRAVY